MNATKPLFTCWTLVLLILASCGDQSGVSKTPATTDGGMKASGSATPSPSPSPPPSTVTGTKPAQSVEMPAGGVGVATNGALRVVPQRFELGNIDPGSSHPRTFTVANVSAAPLTISRAATSCKCTTTTSVANRVLAPGETIDFEVNLDAPRTPGVKEAKVQLMLEGGLPPVQLTLSGDVTMAIKASPPYIGGVKGDQSNGVITLESNDGRPFTILSAGGVVAPGDQASDSRSKHTLPWNLADGPDLSSHLWWVVYTDHPDCPVLPLRIRNPMTGSRADMARYERFWMFDENVVNAGRIKAGESVELDVVIAHYNPRGRGAVENPLWRNVKGVRSLTPKTYARMSAVTPISQDEVRVQFSFLAETGTSGPLYAFVEVETDTGIGRFAVLALVD